MANVQLVKEIYGINTYTKAVDTEFEELLQPVVVETTPTITVDEFFQYYQDLFFEIPVSGSINSHTYLVEQSQQYIGGSVLDAAVQGIDRHINHFKTK